MRTTSNRLKSLHAFSRSGTAVGVHSSKIFNNKYIGQDLTKKWIQRIQSKVHDSASVESYAKLSSLVDFYNKPAKTFKDDIDWSSWKDQIRTAGVVDKIHAKYENFKKQNYNVDLVAQKSTANSEKYDTHVIYTILNNIKGLFLHWNYSLWMRQYLDNVQSLIGVNALGDIQYVSGNIT